MLPVTADSIRLFLHVLGASVWIGGQLVLAGILPVLGAHASSDTVRAVARQFQRLAWPGYALLVATGIWNLVAIKVGDQSGPYLATLMVKLTLVALSGIAAGVHVLVVGPAAVARASTEAQARRRRAFAGASAGLALLFALVAAFMGVQLHG
ncbi:MAG TPA: CopD family protein [Acidimicrobiia bacterium]